jgi:hypothetical protein
MYSQASCTFAARNRDYPIVYAHEVHAHKVYAREMHAHEVHTCEMHVYEVHTYEGFCEDLARQSTVAHLFQRQLGFRRRHTWVSVSSHMGFSHRRSVLKTTI